MKQPDRFIFGNVVDIDDRGADLVNLLASPAGYFGYSVCFFSGSDERVDCGLETGVSGKTSKTRRFNPSAN
jgi:hypothetical protein